MSPFTGATLWTLSLPPSAVPLLMGTFLWFAQQFLKSGNPLDYFTSSLTLELGQLSFHVSQKSSEKTNLNLSLDVAQEVMSWCQGLDYHYLRKTGAVDL